MTGRLMERLGDLRPAPESIPANLGPHVPTEVFEDIREGLVEPWVLADFHHEHVSRCQVCQASRDAAVEQRFDVISYVRQSHAAGLIPGKEVELGTRSHGGWLRRAVQNSHVLQVVAGEGSVGLWNETMLSHFKEFLSKGRKAQVVVGPALSTDDQGRSILLELAKHDRFELFVSKRRQRVHFWVSDFGKMQYMEDEHLPGAVVRKMYFMRDDDPWLGNYLGLRFSCLMESQQVTRLGEAGSCLVPVPQSRFGRLNDEGYARGYDLDAMQASDYVELRSLTPGVPQFDLVCSV